MSAPEPEATQRALGRRALEVVLLFGENVRDVRHVLPPKGVIIGEGKGADLFVSSEGLPLSEFPLVRSEQGKFVLTFAGEQRGEIDLFGTIHPLQWFRTSEEVQPDPALRDCYRFTLPEGVRVTLRFDGMAITLRYVSAPERLEEAPGKRDLRYGALLLGASIALLLAFLGFLLVGQAPEQVVPEEMHVVDKRVARLATLTLEAPKRPSFMRPPLVLGLLSADDTAKALAPKQPEIAACVRGAPAMAHLSVDADGSAFVASVRSNDPRASACLYDALSGVRFVAPLDGGAEIDVTLGE